MEFATHEPTAGDTEDAIFANVPFWKRLGEEYREPLLLTTRRIFSADDRVNSLQLTLKATVSE